MTALDAKAFTRACERLAASDPHLERVVAQHGIPAFWHRPPGFASLVLFIVEQQVSLASAKAVFDRIRALVGDVTPAQLAGADLAALRACGLTRQKLRYVTGLAHDVADGRLDLAAVADLDDDAARTSLLSIVGVGPWTADVYLLSCLRRPDVWPVGDRALQVGTGELLGMDEVPSPPSLGDVGERWRPLRSVAARLIWHEYLARRGRQETVVAGLGPPGI